MKFTIKLLALIFGLLLATAAFAESPREQLKQMVVQLQKNPADNALREKIIKLAQEIKPAPAVPEEAIKFEGRGQFRFNKAKSEQDYIDAAKEYEQAVQSAPWVDGYYSDLCTIYEKAGKYADAKRNCGFSLLATGDPTVAADLKRRIAGLEVGIEQSSPQAQAKRKREADERLVQSLVGVRYYCDLATSTDADGNRFELRYLIESGYVTVENMTIHSSSSMAKLAKYGVRPDNPQMVTSKYERLRDEPRKHYVEIPSGAGGGKGYLEISEDGGRIKRWWASDFGKNESWTDCIRR